MSDIDPILFTIKAAKAANQAAIEALTAVEQMLAEPVLETQADEVQPMQQPKQQPEPEGCQHRDAHEVETTAGRWRICSCGHQQVV
jgi:hypothetical protein